MADKLIAVVDKSTAAKIHISTSVYNGKPRLDIREYYLADNGEWRPTKKGISLDEDSFDQLQEAMKGLQFNGTYQEVKLPSKLLRKTSLREKSTRV